MENNEQNFIPLLDSQAPDIESFAPTRELNEIKAQAQEDLAKKIREDYIQKTLPISIDYAARQNPDQYAEFYKLSKQTGVPVDAIKENPSEIKSTLKSSELKLKAMFPEYPELTEYLSDPDNAAISSDDYETLKSIAGLWSATKSGGVKALEQKRVNDVNWKRFLGEPITEDDLKKEAAAKASLEELARREQTQSKSQYALEQGAYVGGQFVTRLPEGLIGATGGGLAGFTTGIGFGAVTGAGALATGGAFALRGAKIGFSAGTFYSAFKMETASAYEEFANLREVETDSQLGVDTNLMSSVGGEAKFGRKMDEDVAKSAAAIVGAINGGLEYFGEMAMLRLIPKAGSLLTVGVKQSVKEALKNETKRQLLTRIGKQLIKSSTIEGITEATQEAVNIIVGEGAKAYDFKAYERAKLSDSLSRIGQAGLDAAVGSLVFGGVASGFNYVYESKRIMEQFKKSQENYALFTAMGEQAKDSKTLQRVPEKYREFYEAVTKDGPVKNVYVPLEEWNTYFQSKELDPKEVAEHAGSTNYDEAMATKGDVIVPIEKWAERIAPTKHHEALAQDIKFDPETLTPRQAAELKEEFEQKSKKAQSDLMSTIEETKNSMNQSEQMQFEVIAKEIKTGLVEAGREPNVAEQEAIGQALLYVNMARRLNTNALDYYTANQPTFTGGEKARALREELRNLEAKAKEKAPIGLEGLVNMARTGDTAGVQDQIAKLAAPFKEQLLAAGINLDQITSNEQVVQKIQEYLATAPDDSPIKNLVSRLAEMQKVPEYQPDEALFQAKKSPIGFYSPLENAVDEMDFKEMPAKDLLNRIKNAPGLKKDELEWTGFMEWLETKDRVTKEEAIEFLQKNGVQLEQTVRGESPSIKYETVVRNTDEDLPLVEEMEWDEGEAQEPSEYWIDEEVYNYYLVETYRDILSYDKNEQEFFVGEIKKYLKDNEIFDESEVDKIEFKDIKFESKYRWVINDISTVSNPEKFEKIKQNFYTSLQDAILERNGEYWRERAIESHYDSELAEYEFTDSLTGFSLIGSEANGEYYSSEAERHFSGSIEEAKIKFTQWLIDNGRVETREQRDERNRESVDDNEEGVATEIPKPEQESLAEVATKRSKYQSYRVKGGTNYREFLLRLPKILEGSSHKSHWDEPDILLSVRTTDRTDENGKKVLFVEEIQSDLAQESRERGTKEEIQAELNKKEAEISAVYERPGLSIEARKKVANAITLAHSYTIGFSVALSEEKISEKRSELSSEVEKQAFDYLLKLWKEREEIAASLTDIAPNSPFLNTDAWTSLAVKKLLVVAAREGFDKIVFAPGKIQVDRWGTENIAWTSSDKLTEEQIQKIKSNLGEGASLPEKFFVVDSINQRGGVAGDVNIEEEARRRGLLAGSNNVVTTKEELLKIVNEISGESGKPTRSVISITDQIWNAMQAGKEGIKEPRKEGLLYVYDKIIPKALKEVVAKTDKQAKIEDVKLGFIDGEEETTAKSVEVTDAIKERVMKTGLPLFQEKETEHGFITFQIDKNSGKRKFNISLLEKADLSTVLHELGHLYLELLADASEQEGVDPKIKEDFKLILDWLGVKDRSEITREHHEKFARAHEFYVREGRAPSNQLRSAFARYKAWLVNIVYRTAKELNVKINDDVRGVFDRMYASEEQINQIKEEQQYVGMFSNAKDAGLTDAEWKVYSENVRGVSDAAKEKILAKLIKQKQRERDAAWKKQKEIVSERVKKSYSLRKDVKALSALLNGTEIDGKVLRINEADADSKFAELKKKIKGNKRGIFFEDGNASVDEAAKYLGYKNGQELLIAIKNAPNEKDFVTAETERIMQQEHGDMLNDGTLVEEAIKAMHNEKLEEVMSTELRIINKKIKEVKNLTEPQRQAQKNAAKTKPLSFFKALSMSMIGDTQIMDIYPNNYLNAQRKAAKLAFEAMSKGDFDVAKEQKEAELLNHYLYLEAVKAQQRAEKIRKYAKTFSEKNKRQRIGKAGNGYLEAIDAIIEKYELDVRPKRYIEDRQTLFEWLSNQDFENGNAPAVDDEVVRSAKKVNYQELTINELTAVHDSLRSLEYVARNANKLHTDKQKREFDVLRNQIIDSVLLNKKGSKPVTMSGVDPFETIKELRDSYYYEHRKLANLIQEMDGFAVAGILWETIIKPMNEAGSKEALLMNEYASKLSDILKPFMTLKNVGPYPIRNTIFFEKINLNLSWENRMAVALNWGNEGNRQRLLDGQGWSQDAIQDILNSLSKEEWDTVQSIWDLMETLRPMIAEKERRVTGVEPKWVDPKQVETKYGTYRGGYYPIVYDPKGSPTALNQMDEEEARTRLKGTQFASKPRDSFKKSRVDEVKGRPIMLNMNGVFRGLEDVIHDLAWHEWVIDANKIFSDKKIAEAINKTYGSNAIKHIRGHLEDIAIGKKYYSGKVSASGWMDKVADHIRTGTAQAQLGLNLFNSIQNFTGLFQTVAKVGERFFFRGLNIYRSNVFEAHRFVQSKSDFMKTRSTNYDRDVSEIRQMIAGKTAMRQNLDKAFMWLTALTQGMIDTISWISAYEKYMYEGHDEETAIALSDQAVIDSQAAGGVQHLASIQKGNSFKQLFTMFYGFFSSSLNMGIDQTKKTDFESVVSIMELIKIYFYLFIAPTIVTQAIRSYLHREPEEDKDKRGKAILRDSLYYTLNLFPFVREFSKPAAYSLGLEDKYRPYGGPAGQKALGEAMMLWKTAADGNWNEASIKAANSILGITLKLPTAQAYKTISGAMAISDGESEGFMDSVGLLMSGPKPGKR